MAHSGVQIFSRATHIEKCLGCCLLGRAFWAVHRFIYVCMRNKLYTFSFAQMHIHKRLYIHTQVARKRIKKEPAARELWIQKCISQAQTDYLNLFKISQLHYIHNAHPNVDTCLRSTNCCFLLQISRWTKKEKIADFLASTMCWFLQRSVISIIPEWCSICIVGHAKSVSVWASSQRRKH